mgnify:CR=1 FL=1
MKTITKEELLKKYPIDSACRVWYNGQKEFIKYSDMKHINWKNVVKITVLLPNNTRYVVFDKKDGECHSRDGTSYLIK